ncbi:hypothetical protein TSUD_282040 [Trifolium subterraneum]|uniref:DNA-(apurinic or apyrimidinic site) lyase n=1 Tax=Trifolium subterraneum TaxID=3900 RepID=A0A2Z6N114_TRISU|nr:hypothetical protein TSUD_282040 [Trifolium subterraneum]
MKRKRSPKSLPPPPSTPPTPQTQTRHSTNVSKSRVWIPLNLTRQELSLPLTFPTGQTFRWKNTAPSQYTGVVGPHLVSLKQLQNGDVCYSLHTQSGDAKSALLDFLNADVSLADTWKVFSASDERFAELAQHLSGARVLRQDPFECHVEGFDFHAFPTLQQLSLVSEQQLRNAGGEEWLRSLRKLELQDVISELSKLPGVGPKVAACIALYSLDQHHAIPVDVHVWRIAQKYLLPELAGSKLTLKLCNRVAEAFVTKYGKYAGWAQAVLFIAELPSQKALLPSHLKTTKQQTPTKRENREEAVTLMGGESGDWRNKCWRLRHDTQKSIFCEIEHGSSTMHIVTSSFPNLQSWLTEVDNEISVEDMGQAEVETKIESVRSGKNSWMTE